LRYTHIRHWTRLLRFNTPATPIGSCISFCLGFGGSGTTNAREAGAHSEGLGQDLAVVDRLTVGLLAFLGCSICQCKLLKRGEDKEGRGEKGESILTFKVVVDIGTDECNEECCDDDNGNVCQTHLG